MTTPNFLAPYFRYISVAGVTDWTDAITAIRAELVTNPPLDNPAGPAWTEPVSGTFQSPTDADGRFFSILLSRVSQTTIDVIIKNQSGVTLYDGHALLDSTGTEIRIYSGPMHLYVEAVRGTPELFGAGLLDLFPRPQTYHGNYVWGFVQKDTNGNAFGLNWDEFAVLDNGTPSQTERCVVETATGLGAAPLLDASGFTIHRPVSIAANMSGVIRRIGRLYHAYMVDSSLAAGAELQIPINDNPLTNGVFKVLGRGPATSAKMAVRKG